MDSEKKMILIVTENLPTLKDNVIFLQNVLRETKKILDVQIVVKPHPSESNKWYEKTVGKENIKTLVLSRDSDVYEAIYACDLMIAFYSTTVIEAAILGKPVITVNLTDRPDPMPYVERGIAIGVYEVADLMQAIKDALYNEEASKRLAEARKKFVYEHAYLQDGRASERVVNLITQMIEARVNRK